MIFLECLNEIARWLPARYVLQVGFELSKKLKEYYDEFERVLLMVSFKMEG